MHRLQGARPHATASDGRNLITVDDRGWKTAWDAQPGGLMQRTISARLRSLSCRAEERSGRNGSQSCDDAVLLPYGPTVLSMGGCP